MELESIATMDRGGLMRAILCGDWGFPVDFTPEYLSCLSEDKLRHICAALHQQAQAPVPAVSGSD